MSAKNLFARPSEIKAVKKDSELMDYIAEMFSCNEDNNYQPQPQNVKIVSRSNRVNVLIKKYYCDDDTEYTNIAYVYKCSCCGYRSVIVHDRPDYDRYCDNCDEEFNQIGDSKNIEW